MIKLAVLNAVLRAPAAAVPCGFGSGCGERTEHALTTMTEISGFAIRL